MSDEKHYDPLIHIEEIIPILNKIALFGALSDKQLYTVFCLLERVQYEKDEIIFRQGDEPTHIYIIKHGEVKLVVDIDSDPLELACFGAGACIGESGVIGIQPHSATAIATQDTELIVLTSEALLSMYEADKDLFSKLILNIAREACRRLHQADRTVLHYFHREKH